MTDEVGKNSLFASICATLILMAGCGMGGHHVGQENEPAFNTEEIDERLLEANRRFAFRLYAQILQEDDSANVFISPLSVTMALSMTYNGAAAETQRAMAEALHLQSLSIEDVNRSNAAIKNVIEQADPDVELKIANSLWGAEGTPFKKEFLKQSEQYYDALVTELDFSDPQAAKTINKWVSDQTGGKIEEIVDPNIDPLTILFLINAVYFKGDWTKPFDEANTREEDFQLLDGTTKMVPMMVQSGEYAYFRGKGFEAIQLPYGNEQLGMTVFLPDENSSLEHFHRKLNAHSWQEWAAHFETITGTIQMPRFELEYEKRLNDALKAMGMEAVFSEYHANFERMADRPPNVYAKEVKHKSLIEVNEEGSEAAAATSVEMPAPRESFNMRVDRPFFFTIQDNETGTLLFMGSIIDPHSI